MRTIGDMVPRARRGVCGCVTAFTLMLAFAAAVSADTNVLPVAGGAATGIDQSLATAGTLVNPQSVAVLHSYDFYDRKYVIADYGDCLVRVVNNNDETTVNSDVGKM